MESSRCALTICTAAMGAGMKDSLTSVSLLIRFHTESGNGDAPAASAGKAVYEPGLLPVQVR